MALSPVGGVWADSLYPTRGNAIFHPLWLRPTGRAVVPILIDRARMPGEADLPPSLARLAYRNAIDLDQGRDFHHHVDRLIKGIERLLQQPNRAIAAPPGQPEIPAATIPAARERKQGRKPEPIDSGQRPK